MSPQTLLPLSWTDNCSISSQAGLQWEPCPVHRPVFFSPSNSVMRRDRGDFKQFWSFSGYVDLMMSKSSSSKSVLFQKQGVPICFAKTLLSWVYLDPSKEQTWLLFSLGLLRETDCLWRFEAGSSRQCLLVPLSV